MTICRLSNDWQVKPENSSTWQSIFTPSPKVKIEHTNVATSDSGRDTSGVMHITWLQRDIAKVGIHYEYMTESELSLLKSLLQGKEFSFRYPDLGTTVTIANAYCGECSYTKLTDNYLGTGISVYEDCNFNIIDKGVTT